MNLKRLILAALAAAALACAGASAWSQSSPGLIYGQVPTAAQWNSYFAAKADYPGYSLSFTFPLALNPGTGQVTSNSGRLAYRQLVSFASGNTDTAIAITLPTGISRYKVTEATISGATGSLTTATVGIFTATGGGGVAIVTGASAITVNTASENTNNNSQSLTINNVNTISYNAATLYVRVGTATAQSATVTLYLSPMS